MFKNFFYRPIYEIMWKNVVQPGRLYTTIWRMYIACWIPNTTLRVSNAYCISTVTIVPRAHLRATLYVYCLRSLFNFNVIFDFKIVPLLRIEIQKYSKPCFITACGSKRPQIRVFYSFPGVEDSVQTLNQKYYRNNYEYFPKVRKVGAKLILQSCVSVLVFIVKTQLVQFLVFLLYI
jgi:hypothetical protein